MIAFVELKKNKKKRRKDIDLNTDAPRFVIAREFHRGTWCR
jgi:hypothetical protein